MCLSSNPFADTDSVPTSDPDDRSTLLAPSLPGHVPMEAPMRVSSEIPTGMSLPTHPPAPPVPPPPIARQPGPIWGFSSGPGVIVLYDEKDSAKIEAHYSNRLKKQKDWKMRLVVLCGTSRHVLNTREMLVVIDSNLAVELQRSADPPHQDPGFELPFLSPSCPDGTLPNNAGLAHEPPPRENYHQRAPKKGKSPNPMLPR